MRLCIWAIWIFWGGPCTFLFFVDIIPPEKSVFSQNSSSSTHSAPAGEDFKGKHFYWNSPHLIITLKKKTNLRKIFQKDTICKSSTILTFLCFLFDSHPSSSVGLLPFEPFGNLFVLLVECILALLVSKGGVAIAMAFIFH